MSCTTYTLKGLNAICKEGKGGLMKVWLAPFDEVEYTPDASNNTIEIQDVSNWKCYAFRANSASATSTFNANDNGGDTWATDLVMDFLKQDAVKRLEIEAVTKSAVCAIYKDANKVYHFIGATFPVQTGAGEAATGQAMSDANHYNITLHDEDDHLPYLLDASTAERIEAIEPPTV